MKSLARKDESGDSVQDNETQALNTPGGVKNKESSAVKDARITPEGWKSQPDKNGNDRMCMMRDKMTTCRKKKELHERRKRKLLNRKKRSKTYRGEKVLEATDAETGAVHDEELVVVGADVKSLYPSLPDVEVAVICYKAIMRSGIRFEGINLKTAGKYVAMHLTKEEQAMSPLAGILPRRTAKGGVRPGVSADPRKDDSWEFKNKDMTEYEERMLIAMAVQIGVIAMMNTHQYSFNGFS